MNGSRDALLQGEYSPGHLWCVQLEHQGCLVVVARLSVLSDVCRALSGSVGLCRALLGSVGLCWAQFVSLLGTLISVDALFVSLLALRSRLALNLSIC